MPEPIITTPSQTACVEALVTSVDGALVGLHPLAMSEGPIVARVATLGYSPQLGDRVLVQRADSARGSAAYIIGVLHTSPPSPPAHLRTPSGDQVELSEAALELRDERGELLLRFHTDTRELELVSHGDLTLRAPSGVLRLAAETIELDAATTRSSAEHLSLTARETELTTGALALSAERIISRAEEAFVEVERLLETRASRARLLVKSTLELFARRTSVRSEEDTRIDGKRVLLG